WVGAMLEQPAQALQPRGLAALLVVVADQEVERRVAVGRLPRGEIGAVPEQQFQAAAAVELRGMVDGLAVLRARPVLEQEGDQCWRGVAGLHAGKIERRDV